MPKFEKSPDAPKGKLRFSFADKDFEVEDKPVDLDGSHAQDALDHPWLQLVDAPKEAAAPPQPPAEEPTLFPDEKEGKR